MEFLSSGNLLMTTPKADAKSHYPDDSTILNFPVQCCFHLINENENFFCQLDNILNKKPRFRRVEILL